MISYLEKGTGMQIRKTYKEINPELLYHEVRDFARKHGVTITESKLETYSQPTDSTSFIARGTVTFNIQDPADKKDKECMHAHIVGSPRGETKLMLDIDEKLFPQPKVSALQSDLDFIFGSDEVKPE